MLKCLNDLIYIHSFRQFYKIITIINIWSLVFGNNNKIKKRKNTHTEFVMHMFWIRLAETVAQFHCSKKSLTKKPENEVRKNTCNKKKINTQYYHRNLNGDHLWLVYPDLILNNSKLLKFVKQKEVISTTTHQLTIFHNFFFVEKWTQLVYKPPSKCTDATNITNLLYFNWNNNTDTAFKTEKKKNRVSRAFDSQKE